MINRRGLLKLLAAAPVVAPQLLDAAPAKRFRVDQPCARVSKNDDLIPEIWAKEALKTLMSATATASLVHRDFGDSVSSRTGKVNTCRAR